METFAGDDDDYRTPAEAVKVAKAQDWLKHNEPIPTAVVLAEFGLTEADFDRMGLEP